MIILSFGDFFNLFSAMKTFSFGQFPLLEKNIHSVVVNVQKCDILVSEFELQSFYNVHLRTNTLGKGINYLTSRVWVIYYHDCS